MKVGDTIRMITQNFAYCGLNAGDVVEIVEMNYSTIHARSPKSNKYWIFHISDLGIEYELFGQIMGVEENPPFLPRRPKIVYTAGDVVLVSKDKGVILSTSESSFEPMAIIQFGDAPPTEIYIHTITGFYEEPKQNWTAICDNLWDKYILD